ncbi:MAG: TIGR03943 family putative permease subunit [Limnoraphis robusta]
MIYRRFTAVRRRLTPLWQKVQPWLDPIAIMAWGILLLKYWITGKLNILIHPNYFILTIIGGIGLLGISTVKFYQILETYSLESEIPKKSQTLQHISLFPPGWSSLIFLAAAILGLWITPKTFGSHTALQRGLTESLPVTRTQPQEFRTAAKPEERSLIEWVRMLNVNPEPDSYTGQNAKVTGFIIYPPSLPPEYLWLSRFVITCCAADAYPVGLPVLLPANTNRQDYPQDSWLEVVGQMITQTIDGERRLTIKATKLTPIPEPRNPYEY